MIIDVRKKISALETAKMETREVQKQFLNLGKLMAEWVEKYHPTVPYAKKEN